MALSETVLLDALRAISEPSIGRSLVDLARVEVHAEGDHARVTVALATPPGFGTAALERDIEQALAKVAGLSEAQIAFAFRPSVPPASDGQNLVPSVKNVVLVASGKGGVGKSTVAVNLAVALSQAGAKVGLLDADIYGPSVPILLGVRHAKPKTTDGKSLLPIEAHGLSVISIGFFVDPQEAMVWRGPMLHGAIVQFFRDVHWGELDYLVLDLPPGTGDIQLTIAQQVRVAGAVIVTTPQDLSLADAIKAKAMFDKVDVPTLGVIENMSYFVCPHCGARSEIFDHGGGKAAAQKLSVPFLGEVPLVTAIREGSDEGVPVVAGRPQAPESKALVEIASKVAAEVARQNEQGVAMHFAMPAGAPVQLKV